MSGRFVLRLFTAPVLLVIALGAVVIELLFHVECCPIRDWALNQAGMRYPCHHNKGERSEHPLNRS